MDSRELERALKDHAGDAEYWRPQILPFVTNFVKTIEPKSLVGLVGIGSGHEARALCENHQLVGVDVSRSTLDRLRENCQKSTYRPVLLSAPSDQIPLVSNLLDHCMCLNAVSQVFDCRATMEELHRVLRPGGTLLTNVYAVEDVAFGQGRQIAPKEFMYKNTFYRFFDENELDQILGGLFAIEGVEKVTWDDPPHGPFRPYPHRHVGFLYTLRKLT